MRLGACAHSVHAARVLHKVLNVLWVLHQHQVPPLPHFQGRATSSVGGPHFECRSDSEQRQSVLAALGDEPAGVAAAAALPLWRARQQLLQVGRVQLQKFGNR
jgi:hypothetical protein